MVVAVHGVEVRADDWGIVAGVWGDVLGIAGVVAVLLLDTEWLSSCPCALSTYKGSIQLYI